MADGRARDGVEIEATPAWVSRIEEVAAVISTRSAVEKRYTQALFLRAEDDERRTPFTRCLKETSPNFRFTDLGRWRY